MSGAVTAIATEISAVAANAALAAGASSATVEAVSSIVYTAASIGVSAGAVYGLGAALAPKLPDPQALLFPLKQSMPVRQSAFGRVRVSGAYALYTVGSAHPNFSYDVLALLDGQSSAYVSTYLNDDLMAPFGNGFWWAPGASGKYGGGGSNPPDLVQIDYRLGLPTETAYSLSDVPSWDSSHRGDGVTSLLLTCIQAKREDQGGDFPNGLPQPSVVLDSQRVFDPRDGAQTQGTPSTYTFSDNPVLALLAYTTDASGGMGLDYSRFWAPALTELEAAATGCDATVTTSGMHATLLDAAASGDHKIFLADQTGLTVGTVIQLATETVTVSALGGAGEVDFTVPSSLHYNHPAGELEYWNAAGQRAAYRCAGTYKHDSPPGDVIKSILSSFDGWLGQRGDGALVVRTNTIYAPTVVLTDAHVVGLQLQNFLPDEQATNQFVVSYTDPASAFNKAEAGYVENDNDIAVRGAKPQELYLQWAPSAPQAITVGRAMLARATQQLRGTLTCNLAGLAALGERYIGVQISALPDLNNVIVEVTGRPTINLKKMTVSIPFVATGNSIGTSGSAAICFAIDQSMDGTGSTFLDRAKTAMSEVLSYLGATFSGTVDICAIGWGYSGGVTTSITKRSASAADIADIEAFVAAFTPQLVTTDPRDAFDAAATFFSGTDASITTRKLFVLTDGDVTDTAHAAAIVADCVTTLDAMSPVPECYAVCVNNISTANMAPYDNTPQDGAPALGTTPEALAEIVENALFGTSSTPGSSYTLPPLAPPSGAPLQPLAAPTITSVTPVYPSSGGGVAGATASIVVVDPGGNVTWKVQWKLSADSVWTDAGSSITAVDLPPLTIQTGLIPATGSVDFEVAYIAGSQVSPWSTTTTATIAAPVTGTSTVTASATLTAGQVVNIFASSGAKVRPADVADDTKPADGFVLAGVASAATATVYGRGAIITGLTSLTPGATYWLAASGGITATLPTTGWKQMVGKALSATTLRFDPDQGDLL